MNVFISIVVHVGSCVVLGQCVLYLKALLDRPVSSQLDICCASVCKYRAGEQT